MAKEKLLIVKVGTNALDDPETLRKLIKDLVAIKCRKMLVHSGGIMASKVADSMGIKTGKSKKPVIIDDKMLDIVTMVYGGLVNKRLTALLQKHHINAVGLTGADMNIITADIKPATDSKKRVNWAGTVKKVNGKALASLIEKGAMPVLAPLTHDGKGHILSTEANDIAAQTAKALATNYDVTLVFCFENRGVLTNEDNPDSVIAVLKPNQYRIMKEIGYIKDEMRAVIDSAFSVLEYGATEVIITNAASLANLVDGTHIKL